VATDCMTSPKTYKVSVGRVGVTGQRYGSTGPGAAALAASPPARRIPITSISRTPPARAMASHPGSPASSATGPLALALSSVCDRIALHSPDGVIETGVFGCPSEKKAAKLARQQMVRTSVIQNT
jgi:hypothetical protein